MVEYYGGRDHVTMRRKRTSASLAPLVGGLQVHDCVMGTMVSSRSDRVIGRSLALTGDFQTAELTRTCEFLESETNFLSARQEFVDVGANIGTHTMHALRNLGFRQATCVEPHSQNFRLLETNLVLNGFDGRVRRVNAACSSQRGSAEIRVSPTNSGDHRVVGSRTSGVHEEATWQMEQVALIRLDDVAGRVQQRSTLVWIDTQGHEADVLAGMPKLIRRGVPIAFEFWPYGWRESGRTVADLRHLLGKHQLRDITSPDLGLVTLETLEERFEAWALAETPEESQHMMLLALPQ